MRLDRFYFDFFLGVSVGEVGPRCKQSKSTFDAHVSHAPKDRKLSCFRLATRLSAAGFSFGAVLLIN